MELRFYIDPDTDLPHIYGHGVTEEEVRQVVERPGLNIAEDRNSRALMGQTAAGRHLKVVFVPDEGRKSEPATRENILKALEWLEKTTTKDDLVIFAILTQGSPLGERTVYFASDSTFKERAKDAVAGGDIENYLNKLKSERFVTLVTTGSGRVHVEVGSCRIGVHTLVFDIA